MVIETFSYTFVSFNVLLIIELI